MANTRTGAVLAGDLDSILGTHDRAIRVAELLENMAESFPGSFRADKHYRLLLLDWARDLRGDAEPALDDEREAEARDRADRREELHARLERIAVRHA